MAEILAAAFPNEMPKRIEVVVVEVLVENCIEALGFDEIREAGHFGDVEAVRPALGEPLPDHRARLRDMLKGMPADDEIERRQVVGKIHLLDEASEHTDAVDLLSVH